MSPVHDQSYRRYAGQRRPPGRAWAVILRVGARALLSRKSLIALLAGSWLQFLVRCVQIYAIATYPQARQVIPVDMRMFESFVQWQGLFAFFVTINVGGGLIANDRRANALQVYLAKPLLRMEYIGGKLGILAAYLTAVTLVPALLLIVMQIVLSGSLDFVRDNPAVIPAVTLASLMRVIVGAFTMLALSSMSKSARYAAVLYAGVVFFTQAMYGVLTFITGSTRVAWVSIPANLDVVTDWVFRQPARYETPVIVSCIVLAGLVALSMSVLDRQVRGVEVVS